MPYVPAYIDPGSGSLIIQAVVATVVAVPFFLRHQIARFLRALGRGGPAAGARADIDEPAARTGELPR